MAYTYNYLNEKYFGEFWSSATGGGPNGVSAPITVAADGIIYNANDDALKLFGGGYTLTNSGLIRYGGTSGYSGISFQPGVPAKPETVTNTADGVIEGYGYGIYSYQLLNFTNKGLLQSASTGVALFIGANGDSSIVNTGFIVGAIGIDIQGSTGKHKVDNSGTISGDIQINNGLNTIKNTGTIQNNISLQQALSTGLTNGGYIGGYVNLSATAADTVNNTGTLAGLLHVGAGDNVVTNRGFLYGGLTAGVGKDKVTNSGTLSGDVNLGDGDNGVTNSGSWGGDFVLNTFDTGNGKDTFFNSGTLKATVQMGDGNDTLTNTGVLSASVYMGGGNDTVTNSTTHEQRNLVYFDLGTGDDKFIGGKTSEYVKDGDGKDDYKLGNGDDNFFAMGANSNDNNVDTVDGGGNTNPLTEGGDTYWAASDIYTLATTQVKVNLGSTMRTDLTIGQTLGSQAATSASGAEIGNDTVKNFENVIGGSGNDLLFGNDGSNIISGSDGVDHIFGGAGKDDLSGGRGIDTLFGELGADTLRGGAGGDRFSFASLADSTVAKSGRDTITDFNPAEGDLINFSNISSISIGPQLHLIGPLSAFSGAHNEIRTLETAQGWTVQIDVDGDKKPDMAIDVLDYNHQIVWDAAYFGQNIVN